MHCVSIVMAVYQEPQQVRSTIESVLAQSGVVFELIVVSDGADQAVMEVLESYRNDSRVKIIEQDNQGLTKALINGCRQAVHPFIARIDAGDEMLESRLALQAQVLADKSEVGFVASWVRVQTQERYRLYKLKPSRSELKAGIRATQGEAIKTPFHASVMFRKAAYDEVGGYRPEFYFSQDADLWSRMIEVSDLYVIKKVLTAGLFSERGISGKYANVQKQMAGLIAQANSLRKAGFSDASLMTEVESLRPSRVNANKYAKWPLFGAGFDGLYFIARILTDNKSSHARDYWLRALRSRPWSLKAWAYYIYTLSR